MMALPYGPVREPTRKQAKQGARVHNVTDGKHSTNRMNRPLCPAWQSDTGCANAASQCNAGAHQCEVCLAQDHGSARCPNKGKDVRTPMWAQDPAYGQGVLAIGGGKGKGKKGKKTWGKGKGKWKW